MAQGKFVSYLRVSTARQGRSGLGIEAHRQAVEDFLNGGNWRLVKEFVEVESGKKAERPQLEKAFQHCRLIGAKLVIPCHYDMFEFNTATPDEFVAECQRLGQPYRVLKLGERWSSTELDHR